MNKKYIVLFLSLCTVASVFAQKEINVSSLNLTNAYQQYGIAFKGHSATGELATVQGKTYTDVLGVYAKSLIKIDLHRQALAFKAQCALADESAVNSSYIVAIPLADGTKMCYRVSNGTKQFIGLAGMQGRIEKGNVRFVLKGDHKVLYTSPDIHTGDAPVSVDVSLKNVGVLELLVESNKKIPSGDNALWIAPTISYEGQQPLTVAADYEGSAYQMPKAIQQKLSSKIQSLPQCKLPLSNVAYDWLIHSPKSQAKVFASSDGKSIVLANDLVAREFRIFPNLATVNLINRMTGENMLRAVSSEGSVTIDGKEWNLGGLKGQPDRAYCKPEWIDRMTCMPDAFHVEDFTVGAIPPRIRWKATRWALNKSLPTGTRLTFVLRGEKEMSHIVVRLHYDLYDKLPVICKSMEVQNTSVVPVNIDAFKLEYLAFTEPESPTGDPSTFRLPNLFVESNMSCNGGFNRQSTNITAKWVTDPAYTSQCNYELQTPCILQVAPALGPDYTLHPDSTFRSFDQYEMPFDSDDRERKGLFERRFYYYLTPWTTENPMFLHLTSAKPEVVRRAIDQCDSVGYEMIILSFGSGVNAEDTSRQNIDTYKQLVDYAHSKHIDLGCYSLLASRWISDSVDVINPKTGKRGGMRFGSSPCLCSDWGYAYFKKIKTFFEKTGLRCFENDGSYPGDVCASTTHHYHKGLNDSQWNQFQKIAELYKWMCEHDIYLNVPDFYYLSGATKTGIGYREDNWSLPRDRQIILGRQANYRGTWDRLASACWTFVPLEQYHGGGAAATLEPLCDHLHEYEMHMIQNYGAGVQACYRGARLYDTESTKMLVKRTIDWYKKYRDILNSDIIHLRQPDGIDWDGFMHVNPKLKEKGFALFFNPTDQPMIRTIHLPLYYTGLTSLAHIREKEGQSVVYKLNRDYSVDLQVQIPANGYTWYVVE